MAAPTQKTQAQQQYVEIIPDIERIAGLAFDRLNPADREEAVAENRAMVWKNHLHCDTVGKNPGASSMGSYATKNVKSRRRFAGPSSVDAFCPQTQLQGRASVTYTGSAPAELGDGLLPP